MTGRRRVNLDRKWRTSPSLRLKAWRALTGRPTRMLAVLTAGLAAVILYGPEPLPYVLGQRLSAPVIAEVNFTVADTATNEYERRKAREHAPSHYTFDESFAREFARRLRVVLDAAAQQRAFESLVADESVRDAPPPAAVYAELCKGTAGPAAESVSAALPAIEAALLDTCTVRDLQHEPRDPRSAASWIVVHRDAEAGDGQRFVPIDLLVPVDDPEKVAGAAARIAAPLPEEVRAASAQLLASWMARTPTLHYETEATQREIEARERTVQQAVFAFKRGESFVVPAQDGRPSLLTPRDVDLLHAHRAAYESFLQGSTAQAAALRLEAWLQRLGRVVLATLVAIGLVVYVAQHQSHILEHRRDRWTFGLLVLGTLAATRFFSVQWPVYRELVLIPSLCCAGAFAIFFPRRFAIGAMSIVCVLAAIVVRGSLPLLLTLSTGAAVMAFQLDAIRSRTRIITAGLLTAVATALAGGAGDLIGRETLAFTLHRAYWAAGCALAAAFFISGFLPFVERVFRLATPLMLMQYRDSTQPLLQLLAREAPGTYQHSLTVSKLAEEACLAIRADALLASVGALYHDVGKIFKPEYFTENQSAQINRHQNLAPRMSLLIILSHVKDGVELAREYKLPPALVPFIREHHGTTLVRYFHHIAAEKQPNIATGKHDRDVSEAEFRYPGPRPRTRETAVLMLCDGVEGAVRALRDPSPGRIESVVHQIVMDRLNDGQFDECEITLAEIHSIEQSLVKSLCSLYHGRVAYPRGTGAAQRPAEAPPRQTAPMAS